MHRTSGRDDAVAVPHSWLWEREQNAVRSTSKIERCIAGGQCLISLKPNEMIISELVTRSSSVRGPFPLSLDTAAVTTEHPHKSHTGIRTRFAFPHLSLDLGVSQREHWEREYRRILFANTPEQ